ncbi:MAG: hypothetical protein HOF74_00250 [Gammaproteobacteria bacterium]|jgi:hypothetical protein|nr:hypothetical protein [Gammaproteobacteria bacterium]MBT3858237.1 hypothetical protein [Gammaproteobacteria bacterium]MBT3988677.1 hypothetical protein [Gammaproteobacteria bacterium]MBT4255006.1 hypothetical protein [Gammaproteobacteria bacterium]MBT4580633.1 hypothetical protein [Gammaproteobacteria bacterium]
MISSNTNIRLKLTTCIGLTFASVGFSIAVIAQADYSMVNARDTVHINSCGSCHLPYSPGLLPMESWQTLMGGLDEHFGEHIELSEQNSKHILGYFEKYALKEGQQTVMGQLANDLPSPSSPSLRITDLPVFKQLHNNAAELMLLEDLSRRALKDCETCHRAAASHIFDKSLLQIGYGDGRLSDYK